MIKEKKQNTFLESGGSKTVGKVSGALDKEQPEQTQEMWYF